MSYTQTQWKNGDIITKDKLNKIEDGIYGIDRRITNNTTNIDNLVRQIREIPGGAHALTASEVANMTDTNAIYVYTGHEAGYTFGNWYYYNNIAWTSGGVYNSQAYETDKTLTVQDKAADSRVTGEAIESLNSDIANIESELVNYIDAKAVNGFVYEGNILYLASDGEIIGDGIEIISGGGGGGGGGGEVVDAKLTVTNTTGWLSKTIAEGADCAVTLQWSSIEDGMATGDGSGTIIVNNITRSTKQIHQGEILFNIAPYLSAGQNKVKIRIADVYDQSRTITFTITCISLSISSSFDTSTPYTGAITFSYIPIGAVEKTVKFYVDNTLIGTQVTTVSNQQRSFSIPAQSHGAHSLRVYFEATINEETVSSNVLYYEFISIVEGTNTVIITSPFNSTTEAQYTSIVIPFQVYNPLALTSDIGIYVNEELVSSQTVDRTEHSYTYRANTTGALKIEIKCGTVTKTFNITITQSDIDVDPVTEDLVLYLSSQGRSNREEHPEVWEYGNISATLSNFNFASDGWQQDEDGITVMRVTGDARIDIPYQPFATDFRSTGKTIELEFATRNVLNYDSVVMSCMSEGRGFNITAQKALLSSEQSEISTQYKEDEHVRIAFVAEKRAENRLLYIFINGIASGVVQYPNNDDFSQVTPVDITIGSNDCTIDIYCIRIYDNNLTRYQIVNNWIADTQNGGMMIDRYEHNNVYDEYGNIVISALPNDLPYLVIECAELPQYKGDKKTCAGRYVDPVNPAKSFTYTNAQFDVQGTSSQYYARKNYKAKFNDGFVTSAGTVSKYAMNDDAIPVKTFCFKADVASSEGANNVELVRLYNDACPYQTPAQQDNSKVRQGIDGFPIVIFWYDTVNGTTSFLGKYNFNNDKSTEDVFGFDELDESWEILNNTSQRVIFKNADFSGDGWLNDFEARYPDEDPAYEDCSQLAEFAAWAVSTDTTAATGNALPASVTYDGVTYTSDTAAYRLAKFKNEAGDYMELNSALFYYLFTELFLMVDSRAKNAFPSFMGEVIGQ